MHQTIAKVVIQGSNFKANIGFNYGTIETIDFHDDCRIGFLKEGNILKGEVINTNSNEYFLVTDYVGEERRE